MVLSATSLPIDVNPFGSSQPTEFVVVGDTMYFVADDGSTGFELWRTDGTSQGTEQVTDLAPGAASSNPTELTAFKDELYFVADDGNSGRELWKVDGVTQSVVLVRDLTPGLAADFTPYTSNPAYLTVVGETLFFTANDAVTGIELWKTDGTANGTSLVRDIAPGEIEGTTIASSSVPAFLTEVDGMLYFTADDGETGRELWKSDGTEEGTVLVKDIFTGVFEYTSIYTGQTYTYNNTSNPGLLTAVGGTLFFVAADDEAGAELWMSNGAEEGTVRVADINPGFYSAFGAGDTLVALDGMLYFSANDGEHGAELWKSDGTEEGTVMVKDIQEGAEGNLNRYGELTVYDGQVFFSANDGVNGKELWKSNGMEEGTVQVTDIHTGTYDDGSPRSAYPFDLSVVDGVLYFSAFTADTGRELWMTDGTTEGTELVTDAVFGPAGDYPLSMIGINGQLFYTSLENGSGRELRMLVEDDSFRLTVTVDSQAVEIPELLGVSEDGSTGDVYTLSDDGLMFLTTSTAYTLGDVFEVWRTDAGLAGENPDATFSSTELMGMETNGEYSVQMFVNGVVVTDFENYVIQAGDDIAVAYTANPIVSLVTNYGAIVIELFETETPGTVENFLNYVNDGDYLNSFFHRSVDNFVIQGGGFTTDSTTFTDFDNFGSVPTDPTIENEPGISNLRGTIAMAKVGSDPDSATSQFFVNLGDNSFLDEEVNNAFTVFGQVLSMQTVDNIAGLPTIDEDPNTDQNLYNDLPVGAQDQLVVIQSVEGLGGVTGVKFLDVDADGVFNEGDITQSGVRVYIDENNNGVFDSGETFTTTDDEGRYLIQLEPGAYTVRAEDSGGVVTTLSGYTVVVELGREVDELDFGEQFVGTPTGVDLVADSDSGAPDDDLTKYNNADADSTLSFLVTGVTVGGEVRIYANDVLIGSVIADSTEMIVETDGVTGLSDGMQQITATVALTGFESGATDPLAVTIDATAPGAVTTNLPAEAQVGTQLSVDLASDDEGSAGVTYSLVGAPAGMTIDPNSGLLQWTPTLEQAVPQQFSVMVSDEAGNEAAVVFDLLVLGVIAARSDEYETDEEVTLEIDAATGLLANDGDGSTDGFEASIVDQPAGGTVVLNEDGSFTYTPTENFFGADTFTYMVTDGVDVSNIAIVTINVAPVQDPPQPADDSYTLNEDEPLTVAADQGVLANDSDPDGDLLTVSVDTEPVNGTLTLEQDGSFTYTPDADFVGADSFTYTVSDGTTTSDPVTVSLEVLPVNDAPVAGDDAYEVVEDGALNIDADEGLLVNDSDIDSESLTTQVVSGPANGVLDLEEDGSFTYIPDADFFGDDTFTYEVSDGDGGSTQATVTITVNGTPDAPTAADDSFEAPNDGTTVTLDVLANDTDPDGDDTFTVSSVSTGSLGGTITISDDGLSILYVAPIETIGSEVFTYTIEDADGLTSSATVTIEVLDAGDVTISGFVYVDMDNDGVRDEGEAGIPGVLITLSGTEANGSSVSRTVMTGSDGSYVFEEIGSGSYQLFENQPAAHADGLDSTTIPGATVGDDLITGIVASGDSVFTENNFGEQGLSSPYFSIAWAFATRESQEALHREAVAMAEELAGNGDLAEMIREGADVEELNTSPVAAAESYTTSEDSALVVSAGEGLLVNDTDAEGDPLTAWLITNPSNGTLALAEDGSFTYTPAANFFGVDTFTYQANDGELDSAIQTVTITVEEVNDAPIATADEYSVEANGELVVSAGEGLLLNDSDTDGDILTAELVEGPNNGTLSLDEDGSLTYTPAANFTGVDTFTYLANDGDLDSAVVTVTLNVVVDDNAPTAVEDTYTIAEDSELIVTAEAGVLSNDSDGDGDPLTAEFVSGPTSGVLTLTNDGSFLYTPAENFTGVASFTYVANDGTLDSLETTVTITVEAVNDAPTAVEDNFVTTQDSVLTLSAGEGVLANDSDVDGDAITAWLVSEPSNGDLALEEDGSFVYTPDDGFVGQDTFSYKANDSALDSETVDVVITVDPLDGEQDPETVVAALDAALSDADNWLI